MKGFTQRARVPTVLVLSCQLSWTITSHKSMRHRYEKSAQAMQSSWREHMFICKMCSKQVLFWWVWLQFSSVDLYDITSRLAGGKTTVNFRYVSNRGCQLTFVCPSFLFVVWAHCHKLWVTLASRCYLQRCHLLCHCCLQPPKVFDLQLHVFLTSIYCRLQELNAFLAFTVSLKLGF